MKTLAFLTLGLLLATRGKAECWEISGIVGASMANANFYRLEGDAISTDMRITITDTTAEVSANTLGEQSNCAPLFPETAICFAQGAPGRSVEVYTIEKASSRAIIVQTRAGFVSPLEGFNGGKVMVGNIVGNCQ